MRRLFQQFLISIYRRYPNNPRQEQASLLFYIIALSISTMMLITGASLVHALFTLDISVVGVQIYNVLGTIYLIGVYLVLRRGYLQIATYSFLLALSSVIIIPFIYAPEYQIDIAMMVIPIVAVVLLGWRGSLIFTPLILGIIVWSMFQVNGQDAVLPVETLRLVFIRLITVISIMILLTFFSERFRRLLSSMYADTYPLKLLTQFHPDLSGNENDLLASAITFIRTLPDYHTVQIFTVNEDQKLERRVHMDLGVINLEDVPDTFVNDRSQNAIIEVLHAQRTVTVDRNDRASRRHHFYTDTLSGTCVPIQYNHTLLGILDIQSYTLNTIAEGNTLLLEFVAGQLADSLIYKRNLETLQNDIATGEIIMNNQQKRLRELEQLERQTVQQSWNRFMYERGGEPLLGFDLHQDDTSPIATVNMSDKLSETFNQGETLVEEDTGYQIINIPIHLRGQILGAIGLEVPAQRALTKRQIDILENIMQRLALALENKRLYEQTRTVARREATASNIGNELLASTDVETILRMAAESFNNTLGAIQTSIHIAPDILQTRQMPAVEQKED